MQPFLSFLSSMQFPSTPSQSDGSGVGVFVRIGVGVKVEVGVAVGLIVSVGRYVGVSVGSGAEAHPTENRSAILDIRNLTCMFTSC